MGEYLKTAANILNQVSSKFLHKTLYGHKTKNGSEIIFYFYNIFQMAFDIIQNDEDPEPQNVEVMGIKKWAQYPTRQAQGNGGLHATPRPLHISPKQRPGSLGPKHDPG